VSVFKDFPGLKNLKKKNFKDFQGPARALMTGIMVKS